MIRFSDLPRAARILVMAAMAAATAAVILRLPQVADWDIWDLLALVGLSGAGALAEQFSVVVSHNTEKENFSLTDAIWVPALILARPSVLTFAVVLGTLVGHSIKRWAWFKIAYNVSQFTLAISAAELIYASFHLTTFPQLLTWIAASVAMLAYFTINETFIATIIAMVEGTSLRSVFLLPAGLNVVHAAGNITIGMLAALVWSTGPTGLPLLVAPVVLSYLAYRGWVNSRKEEERARERERMRTLYEAGRALFGPLDADFDYRPFLQLVRKMVDASGVELVVVSGEARVYNSEVGLVFETEADETEGLAERFLSTRPGLSTYLAPINGPNEETGILAVHRAEKLSPAEGSLVEALASQIYVKQENERLFQETLEQKGHLADVIGVSSDGIFVVSPDRRIMSWNPAMERITQFTREEAVEADCDEIIRLRPEPDGRASDESSSLVLVSPQARDALAIRKDRTERWIRYTSNAMPDRDGRAKAYVVVARDVTAELEAERLKDDFVATVSHELRTPLTPLKGFIVSLEQGLVEDSPESRQEYYGIMRRQAERLERLINDLLDVSRIESGSLRLEPQIISLAKTIEEQIRELEPSPLARPVSFAASDDPVWVLADPLRVGQVVANLLSNAFKYSPPGTPVEAQLVTSGSHARVSIHNEGEGLSAADQERVFDRFYRVESTMTRTVGGVGLGLYIAKRLVEAMGGELWLESRPGMGCTFSFTVPLSEDPANRAAANGDGPSALAGAGPGERAA